MQQMASDAVCSRHCCGVHSPQCRSDVVLHYADYLFLGADVTVLCCRAVVSTSHLANLETGIGLFQLIGKCRIDINCRGVPDFVICDVAQSMPHALCVTMVEVRLHALPIPVFGIPHHYTKPLFRRSYCQWRDQHCMWLSWCSLQCESIRPPRFLVWEYLDSYSKDDIPCYNANEANCYFRKLANVIDNMSWSTCLNAFCSVASDWADQHFTSLVTTHQYVCFVYTKE